MRRTVNLPGDVDTAAKLLAAVKGISFGDALAELVRQGTSRNVRIDHSKPFPCFAMPEGSETITLERTLV